MKKGDKVVITKQFKIFFNDMFHQSIFDDNNDNSIFIFDSFVDNEYNIVRLENVIGTIHISHLQLLSDLRKEKLQQINK